MTDKPEDIREAVREHYGQAALKVLNNDKGSCCGDPVTSDLYDSKQAGEVPGDALLGSLGCGNPTALAELKPGETVLDLGSGGGIDVLLSAKRVGPTGFAYGLDMTDEMLALAEKNKTEAGVQNVRFLKGHIEDIPLPDSSVDVIISNCVINLSADKDAVLREAFRVLRPGGRFAVSDIVLEAKLPEAVEKDLAAYYGCLAGALQRDDYVAKLRAAGFGEAEVQPTRRFSLAEAGEFGFADTIASLSDDEKARLDGGVVSAFIRARKPKE
jgi:SAM-dependent methyltransferase